MSKGGGGVIVLRNFPQNNFVVVVKTKILLCKGGLVSKELFQKQLNISQENINLLCQSGGGGGDCFKELSPKQFFFCKKTKILLCRGYSFLRNSSKNN